jgi:hypothetical protein
MLETHLASTFLNDLDRIDLSILLKECQYELLQTKQNNGFFDETVEKLIVHAPQIIASALEVIPDHDKTRVAEALSYGQQVRHTNFEIIAEKGRTPSSSAALLAELLLQREIMIAVATGQQQIQDVNDYYKAREVRLGKAIQDKNEYSNPHSDLWDWYKYWKQNLPSYSDRRSHIRKMFETCISKITIAIPFNPIERELSGWERVDRTIIKARDKLINASNEEEYQSIGLLCRETIISLAQVVFDPNVHLTLDGIKASSTDANRMLEAFIAAAMPGGSEKEVRSHARASLALALHLQHRRTANRKLAELCLEATSSTVAVIKIIHKMQ